MSANFMHKSQYVGTEGGLPFSKKVNFEQILFTQMMRITELRSYIESLGRYDDYFGSVLMLHSTLMPYRDKLYREQKKALDNMLSHEIQNIDEEEIKRNPALETEMAVKYHDAWFQMLIGLMCRQAFIPEKTLYDVV